jgi:hypothetical protein
VASPQPWVTDGRSQSGGAVEVKEGEEEDKGEADNDRAEAVTRGRKRSTGSCICPITRRGRAIGRSEELSTPVMCDMCLFLAEEICRLSHG